MFSLIIPTIAIFPLSNFPPSTTLKLVSNHFSQEDFEKPEYVGIDINCGKEPTEDEKDKKKKKLPEEDDTDF